MFGIADILAYTAEPPIAEQTRDFQLTLNPRIKAYFYKI
jgi:hypothetical protein